MSAAATHPEAEKRPVRSNTCSGCEAAWTGLSVAHCAASGCHELFASVSLFDMHRSQDGDHGACIPPGEVQGRNGEQRLLFRDGMWRGPELTEEQRAKLRSVWGGEADDPIPA
jgi:hypothetical protein